MLIIRNGDQVEPLQHYKDLVVKERVNGRHSLSFTTMSVDDNYHLVTEESIIEYDGQDYRIKMLDEQSKGIRATKTVQAHHIFFDLIDDYQHEIIGGNYTLQALLDHALTDTNFTVTVEDILDEKLVFNYGDANALKLVQQACELWGVEWELNNSHIVVKGQIGDITDNQFRYKHNLKAIRKTIDTSRLATRVRGYCQGSYIDYTSPMADIYGIRNAEPIRNDDIDQATMIDLLQRSINDKPDISITIELAQLGFDVKKGDEIILIYEPLDIRTTARIMEIEHNPKQPKASKVTIANYNETVTDIMAMFARDIEQVNKKNEINRSQIRQTNERIELEVSKAITDINGEIEESRSLISQTASEIRGEVSQIETDLNGVESRLSTAETKITPSAIVSTVRGSSSYANDLSAKVDTATYDSQITQLSDSISLKVSETDFNGDTIASKITQSASAIELISQNINLSGKVTFTSFDSSLQSAINDKANVSSLGSLAYTSMVEMAQLGSTIIEGGYIKAELISTNISQVSGRLHLGGLYSVSGANRGIFFSDGSRIIQTTGIDGIRISAPQIILETTTYLGSNSANNQLATKGDLVNVIAKFG